MRSLLFIGRGRVEWGDRPDPKLAGPGEAIVRPLVMGVATWMSCT